MAVILPPTWYVHCGEESDEAGPYRSWCRFWNLMAIIIVITITLYMYIIYVLGLSILPDIIKHNLI